jgi:hypothetical protein
MLQHLTARIAGQQVYDFEWHDVALGIGQRSRIRVAALWVTGPYAHGALDCGDLDLVAQVVSEEEGALPWPSAISRVVIGYATDVHLYIGTPEDNSSGIRFPDARLVWSPAQPDWQAAVSIIAADSVAGGYASRIDALPIRAEQLYPTTLSNPEELVDLSSIGLLTGSGCPPKSSMSARRPGRAVGGR